MAKKLLPPMHLAASQDETAQATAHIHVQKGVATATNGTIIAQLNLYHYADVEDGTIHAMNGALIHRDVWKMMCDADSIDINGNELHYVKDGVRADIDISCDFKYPDASAVVRQIANSSFMKRTFICFNPVYIDVARKIFPSTGLVARFYEKSEMIVVFPSGGEAKGFVAIVPLEIDETEALVDFSAL
jgi:hypothetical protein